MSRQIYDFLNDSFLFDSRHLEENYRQIGDRELEIELQKYREHVLSQAEEISQNLANVDNSLSIYFDTSQNTDPPIGLLKQSALYYDRATLDDPLFRLTYRQREYAQAINDFYGLGGNDIDRERIVDAVKLMHHVRPMVAGNYVTFAQISRELEPSAAIPVFVASDSLYADSLPKFLIDWFHDQATVNPMRKFDDGGWHYFPGDKLEPCRAICITFKDYERMAVYFLSQTTFHSLDESTGHVFFGQKFPSEPPATGLFNAWVLQSINQASRHILKHLATDLKFSHLTHSMLFTQSPFIANLLKLQTGSTRNVNAEIANLSLRLELPLLDNISIEDLMRVRNQEGEAFRRFRSFLGQSIRELRHVEDHDELAARLSDVEHELMEIQVPEVESEISRIKKDAFGEAIFAIASLAALIPTGGVSLAGVLLSAIGGYNTAVKYIHEAKGHPAYFLWRLKSSR